MGLSSSKQISYSDIDKIVDNLVDVVNEAIVHKNCYSSGGILCGALVGFAIGSFITINRYNDIYHGYICALKNHVEIKKDVEAKKDVSPEYQPIYPDLNELNKNSHN